ncbi:MAG: hypothetical protein JWR63_4084, partial [Conexibacter sp.]|nr:hypothetical protein [Conexibacter sp.]
MLAFLLATLVVVLPARAEAADTGGTSYPTRAQASQQTVPVTPPAPTPPATVGADGLAVAP